MRRDVVSHSRVPSALSLLLLASLGPPASALPPGAGPEAKDAGAVAPLLAKGDGAWARRGAGSQNGSAFPGAIDEACEAYRQALAEAPGSLEAAWRLMRALYFRGEHATTEPDEKRRVFDEGRQVGEKALEEIRRQAVAAGGKGLEKASPVELVPWVKGRNEVTATFLWAGVDWGKWAIVFGKTAAVKQGAAAKIRDYAEAVIALDPRFEDAGGYRVLGRLHHQTPAVPFFTGWASRSKALENLRLAHRAAPANFVNRLYLAEALWEYEKKSRGEARALLEALVADAPSAGYPVEDRRAQEEARALLSAWAAQ